MPSGSVNANKAVISSTARQYYKHLYSRSHWTSTQLSESNDGSDEHTPTTIEPSTKSQIRSIAKHLSSQTLETLLSKSEALAISNELFFTPNKDSNSSPLFNDNSREQYIKYWNKIIQRLREETRTPADLLGEQITQKILKTIRGDDVRDKRGGSYDANTVRTFLESDAVNSLFAKLLYDAIFEFTTKFDILGE